MSIEILQAAFMAGFMSSAEGWNGEYPFNHPGRPTEEDKADLEAAFHNWRDRRPPFGEE